MKFIFGYFLCSLISLTSFSQDCFTCPQNIVIKTDSTKEGAIVNFPALTSNANCEAIVFSKPSGSFFRIGSHSVIVTSGNAQRCSFTIMVTDNEPPTLSPVTLSSKKIWPPSDKMKRVGVYYTAKDNGEIVTSTVSVSSNDDLSGIKDSEVINNHMVRLKASRLPNGEARVYTITVTSTDAAGNIARRKTSIVVGKGIDVKEIDSK